MSADASGSYWARRLTFQRRGVVGIIASLVFRVRVFKSKDKMWDSGAIQICK